MFSGTPITAYALCNALGVATADVLRALEAGKSGLKTCSLDLPFAATTGELVGPLDSLPAAFAAFDNRQTRIAWRVLGELVTPIARARQRWGAERVAIVIGTSTSGIESTERAFGEFKRVGQLPAGYDWDRQHAPHAVLDVIRARTGLAGPAFVISTACSSSGKVFGTARRLLRANLCDAVLVGGVDSLCQTTLRGFHSLEVLSPRACRPFAQDRAGLNIGEGGALLLLEREGEALARLLGVGETSDGHHMTAPRPDGAGARAAMEQALAQAQLAPAQIDHINAHGTATLLNDAAEASAIRALFGGDVPVASTKGYTGHLLGAAGATEAIFAVAALERGWIPASIGCDPVDPALKIRVNPQRLARRCRHVLSNSFAFGGSNVSVLFGANA